MAYIFWSLLLHKHKEESKADFPILTPYILPASLFPFSFLFPVNLSFLFLIHLFLCCIHLLFYIFSICFFIFYPFDVFL